MKHFLVVIMFFSLTGCAGSIAWQGIKTNSTETEARANNEKIMNLNIGQPKTEVLKIMGSPAKREAYQLENKKIVEFLFYRTTGWASSADYADRDYQFTPLAFENDKLVGWGRNYYDSVVRHAVDISVK